MTSNDTGINKIAQNNNQSAMVATHPPNPEPATSTAVQQTSLAFISSHSNNPALNANQSMPLNSQAPVSVADNANASSFSSGSLSLFPSKPVSQSVEQPNIASSSLNSQNLPAPQSGHIPQQAMQSSYPLPTTANQVAPSAAIQSPILSSTSVSTNLTAPAYHTAPTSVQQPLPTQQIMTNQPPVSVPGSQMSYVNPTMQYNVPQYQMNSQQYPG